MLRSRWTALSVLALAACGGGDANEIVGIQGSEFPANEPFTMTVLVMAPPSCADIKFNEISCNVDVNEDENEIFIDARVPFDEPDGCLPDIGIGEGVPVDCEVEGIEPGQYTVRGSGGVPFRATIQVF